jgi:hypothetical protein
MGKVTGTTSKMRELIANFELVAKQFSEASALNIGMQADRISQTLLLLWEPIRTAVQSQFADSLVVDDRQPIYTLHDNDDGTPWIVLPPKWELWRQLIVVRVLQSFERYQCLPVRLNSRAFIIALSAAASADTLSIASGGGDIQVYCATTTVREGFEYPKGWCSKRYRYSIASIYLAA